MSKYEHELSKILGGRFQYKFVARVMPGPLPKRAFSMRIRPFQMTFFKDLLSPNIAPNLRMNGGQTLHLPCFQHIFIFRDAGTLA